MNYKTVIYYLRVLEQQDIRVMIRVAALYIDETTNWVVYFLLEIDEFGCGWGSRTQHSSFCNKAEMSTFYNIFW